MINIGLIESGDELTALLENAIAPPKLIDLGAAIAGNDGFNQVLIGLIVHGFLRNLFRHTQCHFRGSDAVFDVQILKQTFNFGGFDNGSLAPLGILMLRR